MAFLFLLLFPSIAFASLDSFLGNVDRLIVNPLIELMFAVALVYFLYGVFEFVINQTNEESRTKGKGHMLWGVIGMTVMMGVWGLLSIVLQTFDIKGVDPQNGTVNLNNYNPTWPRSNP